MNRNIEIDRLRAILAICVLLDHVALITNTTSLPSKNGFGTTIIDISFIISGYVISATLLKIIDKTKNESRGLVVNLKAFYVKRFFRIYPGLWAVFFFVTTLSLASVSGNIPSITTLTQSSISLLTSTYNFFFISNFYTPSLAPLWSLTIEEQFYIFFPIFLILTKNNRQRTLILILMILLITFIIRPMTINKYGIRGLYFTQSRCDAIMYGCLIYIISIQPWFSAIQFNKIRNRAASLSLCLLHLYVVFGLTVVNYSPSVFIPINNILSSVVIVSTLCNVGMFNLPPALNSFLDYLAPRSYGLYIIHFPSILIAVSISQKLNISHDTYLLSLIILSITLSFIFSEILYQAVIKPSINQGYKISNSIKRASSVTTGEKISNA